MEIKNWILKKHIKDINVLSYEYMPFYANLLKEKGILVNNDLSKSNTFINWNLYPKKFDFFYDYENNELKIAELFGKSDIIKSNNVCMDFGYGNPIISLNTNYFIDNWYDFIKGAHFESTVVSDNGLYIMEFTRQYDLISNFRIK